MQDINMKNKRFKIAAAAAVLIVIALYFFSSGRKESSDIFSSGSGKSDSIEDKIRRLREGDPNAMKDIIEDEKARKNLKEIAKVFENELRFPVYSRPIDTNSHDLLNPHEFIPVQRSFPGNEKLFYDLVLSKQVMIQGEPISATLRVTSKEETVPDILSVKARLVDEDRGRKTVANFDLKRAESTDKSRIFTAEYTPSGGTQLSDHMIMVVTFQPVGYSEMTVTAQFTYADPAAKVTGIGNVTVDGAHLVIPVNLETKKSGGDYRVTGNLYSSGTDRPLVNAFGVAPISGSSGTVEIKIHAAALREKGDPGPYILKTLTVDRLPTTKEPMLYGTGQDKEFKIPGHDLKEYSDEAYSNPDDQKKLEMLKNFLGE
jgi:hypothetical protein